MLHEPLQHQLARLGLRGAADALQRLPCNDETIDALALLLDAECLHRDSLAQSRRIKLAKLGQSAHPADVDLRTSRSLGKARWQQLISLNWFKQHQHVLIVGPTGTGKELVARAIGPVLPETSRRTTSTTMPWPTSTVDCSLGLPTTPRRRMARTRATTSRGENGLVT